MNASTTPDAPAAPEPAELLRGLAAFAGVADFSVSKDGVNPHFNYSYMTEPALFAAARSALAASGLSATISFENGMHEIVTTYDRETGNEKPNIMATVTARLTIRDVVGNSVECLAYGQGIDPADKAYAKAMTMAAKYVVQKAFMIGVDSDDTDSQNADPVRRRSGGSRAAAGGGVASEKQIKFATDLVKRAHLDKAMPNPDQALLRLLRHELKKEVALDAPTAAVIAAIDKGAMTSLIDKLQTVKPAAAGTVWDRVAAWEVEQGISSDMTPGGGEAATDMPPANPEGQPINENPQPVGDDDIPF